MLNSKIVRAGGSPAPPPPTLLYALVIPFQTTPEPPVFVTKQMKSLLASNP